MLKDFQVLIVSYSIFFDNSRDQRSETRLENVLW